MATKQPPRAAKGAARTVAVRTPNAPDYVAHVDAAKYGAMRRLLMTVLPRTSPGLTQAEMMAAVARIAPKATFPGATFQWWAKCVQLDLEVRGLLRREDGRPLRWHVARPARATAKRAPAGTA